MSSSVKRLLRSTRECLGRREYREALQHCKEVLTEDKTCYEAYIYVGKAAFHLQEHAQAEAAYRRASDLDGNNPLAWQGLAELFTEIGNWMAAAECYSRLLQLADAAGPEEPLRARRGVFLRRLAEAAARSGQLAAAEAAWRALAEEAAEGAEGAAAAAAAAEGQGEGTAAAAVAAAEDELVECLCRLADVQLAEDTAEIEVRVASRLAEEGQAGLGAEQAASLESAVRGAVEGEWAEEALELDADHASATLRRIIALRPPAPPYVPYYDAFLKRLRKYIQAAPPGSMDRHTRRAVLLAAAKATMEGKCGSRAGGCCSPYPFEAALAMLEVEHEVAGAEDPSLDPHGSPTHHPHHHHPAPEPPPLPLLVADCGRISSRLLHAFPWSPAAQLHNALSLRRRAAAVGDEPAEIAAAAAAGGGAGGGAEGGGGKGAKAVAVVARLPSAVAATGATAGMARGRPRQVTKLLLSALSRGARGVSGWLAACQQLLEGGAEEAALDAAKEGLKYVAHRDLVGKERLGGAGLLLRLLAGQALLRLRKLEEAQLLLEGLAHGVSEGHVASGELAGIPPINVSQEAKRYLAHAAAARGDWAGCRHRYDELVGGQLMGRSAAHIEAWAHGELGMLLLRQGPGTSEGARFHLQAALNAVQPALASAAASAASPAATTVIALQQEAAAYHLHLALAIWVRGGGKLPYSTDAAAAAAASETVEAPTAEPFRTDCREHLLAAAAVAGPLQAAAFTWLGHWYGKVSNSSNNRVVVSELAGGGGGAGGDGVQGPRREEVKARRCYQRALVLDPAQAGAGEALVASLCTAGRPETARQLCEEVMARTAAAVASPGPALLFAPSPFLIFPGLLPVAGGAAGGAAAAAGGGGWALRCLARLQRDSGAHEAAVATYQSAIRREPGDAEMWEGLAASYQALGRHTAALKSYNRALELSPTRLFSRLQAAALHYQLGEMPAALSYYRTALAAAPSHPAALLGCGEVLLAQAAAAARAGAAGAAAAELAEATTLAARATGQYGNLQAGWKLLGDVRMQHAAVPTLESVVAGMTHGSPQTDAAGIIPAVNAVQSALDAARQRVTRLRSARRAYAAALHLDPRVAGLWGDVATSYHLQLEVAGQHPELERELEEEKKAAVAAAGGTQGVRLQVASPPQFAAPQVSRGAVATIRLRALSLARGGLRLDPASDWLWACSGTIAAAASATPAVAAGDGRTGDLSYEQALQLAAAAEYCYSRALQLNPRRAGVWAALGRLYATHGAGGLASRCFDAARSHEPTSVAVWEAMGDAALRGGGLANAAAAADGLESGSDPRVSPAWRDAADAYEHAQLLGGDVESRLGFILGTLLQRRIGNSAAATASYVPGASDGAVLAAACKAAAMHPLLPAAHHARGLALEARGDYEAAVQAFKTALALKDSADLPHTQGYDSSSPPSTTAVPAVMVRTFDPRVAPAATRTAIELDLARVLTSSPAPAHQKEALGMYGRLLAEGAVRHDDYGAMLSYTMGLQQAGRTSEALPFLLDLSAAPGAPIKLRLAAATAAVRNQIAVRRWDEVYGVVLTVTADLPEEEQVTAAAAAVGGANGGGCGGSCTTAVEMAARLWRVLLAGLVTARAPELEGEMLVAMRQWAAGRRDLDGAHHECRVQELLCMKHLAAAAAAAASNGSGAAAAAAAAATLAATRQAARAVHIRPTDVAAKSLLAAAALQVGSRHAALAARVAPRARPPHNSAAADGVNAVPSLAAAAPLTAPLAASAAAAHAVSVVTMPAAAAAAAAAAAIVGGGGAASLTVAVREAAARMRRVVHAQPNEASAWYLCALTELQHAIASGGQARLYRSAAVAARAAAAAAQAELAALPAEAAAGAAAAAAPSRPVGLPPVLAMALAAQAARAHAPPATDPRVAALRARRVALADAAVRSLAILSECRLQLRGRAPAPGAAAGASGVAATAGGGGAELEGARQAAEEALRVAVLHRVDASPAHRQLARLQAAQGDFAAADASYEQACRTAAAAVSTSDPSTRTSSYHLLPALEWAAVLAASGRGAEALQRLDAAVNGNGNGGSGAVVTVVVPSRPPTALTDVAAVQRALLMLQLGEVEAARATAAEAAVGPAGGGGGGSTTVMSAAGLRSAAHTVQAAAALVQAAVADAAAGDAGGGGGTASSAARKKCLLEARWAAREALKPQTLSRPAGPMGRRGSATPPPGPMGPGAALAALVLGRVEAALGKDDTAREALTQAARLWPRSAVHPPEAFAASASDIQSADPWVTSGDEDAASGGGTSSKRQRARLAHAVHCRPWSLGAAWGGLVATARAG